MKRRPKPTRKAPQRKPRRKLTPSAPPEVGASEADPLADPRIRPLLERYCALARVKQAARGPDHTELRLPQAERPFFRDRESLRVAFSLDALQRDPDAEIAVLGSPFLSQLIEAIRARGARLSLGLMAPSAASDAKRVELTIPVRDGVVKRRASRVAVHPVGRLVARVVVRAGAGVEEAVVESDVYDLSAGVKLDDDLAGAFRELEARRIEPADESVAADAAAIPAREPADLLRLLLSHLQEKSAERVAARREVAERDLALELGRLDRYFESILKEQSDADGIGTVTALAERRRTEEIRRSEVKAVVHPLQLIEATVLMQRAEWQLESAHGRRATFSAQRPLSGSAGWIMACPHCGRPPAGLVICRHDHCGCEACSSRCSVCAEDFCADHGIAQCRVDGQPACDEHVRVCPSCRLEHCTVHEGVCSGDGEGDGHKACSACLAPCGSCGKVVCNRHAEQSAAEAPKGSRRLCAACLRSCEGGDSESVGVDEVTQCASCGKTVCTTHGVACAVDGQVHCSQHLRRTETSRRLVCARHRATCAEESAVLLASDEVGACASCGKLVCASHSAECVTDRERHCLSHLEPLVDANGARGCPEHRGECHVDGQAYLVASVSECPICGKGACAAHRATCGYCGRHVCTTDLNGRSRRCVTCAQLAAVSNPLDSGLAAVLAATGEAGKSKSRRNWRMARDRTHSVVELDLGWSQKGVFTVRHGHNVPDGVVKHSLLGSKRRK